MHLHPTPETTAAFFGDAPRGPIVMLNLLRFREIADYTESPELAPSSEIGGPEAFALYAAHTTPFLEEAGAEILFRGSAHAYLIGPNDEQWDLVILVRHKNAASFGAFATNPDYTKGLGHRVAALVDSRLLPVSEAQ